MVKGIFFWGGGEGGDPCKLLALLSKRNEKRELGLEVSSLVLFLSRYRMSASADRHCLMQTLE